MRDALTGVNLIARGILTDAALSLDRSAPGTVTQSASETKHISGQIDADQGSCAQITSLFPTAVCAV
jgi:hypothetical protein